MSSPAITRIGVPGPSAPTLGEEHHRQPQAPGQLEQAVLFRVVLLALGAGQDRVVVGDDRTSGVSVVEAVAVDAGGPADQPVGRGPLDELVEVAAPALGGDGESAVLGEAPLVDEVGDVSRAVRRPPSCRRATTSGRPASARRCRRANSRPDRDGSGRGRRPRYRRPDRPPRRRPPPRPAAFRRPPAHRRPRRDRSVFRPPGSARRAPSSSTRAAPRWCHPTLRRRPAPAAAPRCPATVRRAAPPRPGSHPPVPAGHAHPDQAGVIG